MPMNTGLNLKLNLKTTFVSEKKKRIKVSEISSSLVQCSLCSLSIFVEMMTFQAPSLIFAS